MISMIEHNQAENPQMDKKVIEKTKIFKDILW